MTGEELAEIIRAAQESAYDQAFRDEHHNNQLPRKRWCPEGHGTDVRCTRCRHVIANRKDLRYNPYRKV